jgi:hypothetical protein
MSTLTKEPTVVLNGDSGDSGDTGVTVADAPIKITRGRIDHLLIWSGGAIAVVLVVAGVLLTWGSSFSEDYVHDELAAQAITFPPAAALEEEGRDDLVTYADQQVDTGTEAEAYASFIAGHVEGIADGATYAELGDVEREAEAATVAALESGAPAAEVTALEEEAAGISGQRDSIFRGEMLRGALLSTFAWSTIGQIAGYAAIAAFIGALVMAGLVIAGVLHLSRTAHA